MGQEDAEGKGAGIIHLVDFSVHFAKIYDTAPANDIDLVDDFVEHVNQNGLKGLPGRLKVSWDVRPDDPFFAKKIQYARTYNLWHYHLGMGRGGYDTSRPYGDWTSEWVLHIRRHPCGARTTIVDWDSHPPFKLPDSKYLWTPGEDPDKDSC